MDKCFVCNEGFEYIDLSFQDTMNDWVQEVQCVKTSHFCGAHYIVMEALRTYIMGIV